MIELVQSFNNRTCRQNDKSARGHERAHSHLGSRHLWLIGRLIVDIVDMTSCETEFECNFKIILRLLCSAVVCKAQREEKNFARREIQSKLGEIYCRLGSLSLLAGGRYYTRAKERRGKKGLTYWYGQTNSSRRVVLRLAGVCKISV